LIVIIQCAATKRPEAGRMKSSDGKPVVFVAEPASAPAGHACRYARPDDISDAGKSWRESLLEYNRTAKNNPLGLYPAYRLYKNPIYERFVDRFGLQNVFILSAGWGLIGADFLTPYYDITFSQSADGFKRRRKRDRYLDISMLPDRWDEEIVFFGGKDYLPLLCSLTGETSNRKTLFYNAMRAPQAPGWDLQRFETTTRTNWHYECAGAFLDFGGSENAKHSDLGHWTNGRKEED
jgi:hypothetical protein